MNTTLRKISTTLLSLLVLFSSMSFTIDEHYCGTNLMDVSYFGDADNCGSEELTMNFRTSSESRCLMKSMIPSFMTGK